MSAVPEHVKSDSVDSVAVVSWWNRDGIYHLRTSPTALISALVLLILVLATVFVEFLTLHRPMDIATLELAEGFLPPMSRGELTGLLYPLGSDDQGRDLFASILFGLRTSLGVGICAVGLAMVLGVTLGLIAGVFQGMVGAFIMRMADIQMTFPSILVALLIFGVARGFVPPQQYDTMAFFVLIISIGLSEWVPFGRTVRAATMMQMQREYVDAARIIGMPTWRILLVHVLPNIRSSILVLVTITLALAIISEATLSYVGVGMQATRPSLGTLIRIGQDFLFSGEWWILLMPSVTLLVLSLSVNLLGDWLRQYFDPRLR